MKILLAGNFDTYTLETSYKNALIDEGHEVRTFDFPATTNKYIKYGKIGHIIHNFLSIEAWIRKTNRELVIEAKNFNPDLLFVFANTPVLTSSFAFMKSVLPVKCILIWPDTVFNLQSHVLLSAPLYDFVASYSETCCKTFSELGFKNVKWIPLAADPHLHYAPESSEKVYDLTFVGGWRPEREEALSHIAGHFPALKLRIQGTQWHRAHNKDLQKFVVNQPLYGKNFTTITQQSRINMNIIDETNYPAANMRFFEIPVAGGFQIASACPEMEKLFQPYRHLLYFKNNNELVEAVQFALDHEDDCTTMKNLTRQLVLDKHTYQHRIKEIISHL